MKKKFINGFLMVAMVFATTSSFVSCKDNVDDELTDVYAQLGKKSNELQSKINDLRTELQDKIDGIEPIINNWGDTIINQITQRFDTTIIQRIDSFDVDLSRINTQITNMALTVDSITNALNNIDVRINAVSDSVDILWARVDSIVGILDALVDGNLITSVTIDATRNDVLGIINTPVIKVDGLVTYYGTNDNGIDKFPYAGYDFNVGGLGFAEYLEKNELPYEGFATLDESDYITDAYANAGQLYFTINSTDYENFDVSKIAKFQIENSAGKVAPIDLKVRKSSAQLNWGFGKAFLEETGVDAKNGFYVADATIKEGDLDPSKFQIEKFINFERLKSEIQAEIDDIRAREGEPLGDGTNDTGKKATFRNTTRELMSIIFDLVHNQLTKEDLRNNPSYSPQRLALYVEKGGQLKRVAQSKFDLFTTAVKPLSYNTFWEYENTKEDNWIIETVLEKAVSRIAQEIQERTGSVAITAEIVSLNDGDMSVDVKVNNTTQNILVGNAHQWDNLKKAVNKNGGLASVNDMLNNLLKGVTLGNATGKAANRINDYLTKGSEYLTNLINKHLFTRAVAPIIIFETNTGMDRLCEGMFIKRGVMHAYLTSGTMEILVPAYRKYVALEKNGMLLQSEVLPGNTLTYDYDLSEKGDYRIIISCVDYFGFVITKKYNVHVY